VAVSRYCLDTSAYSHLKRGDVRVADLLDRAEWVGVPCIVLGELHSGFRKGSRQKQNEAELEEFLADPLVEQLPVDGEVAHIFADIVMDLRRRGTPLPTNDIWIAATCARAGATLVSFDAHFRKVFRIGSLVLEDAADPPG
jgi:tRNA(fMet)-specific endonuclease VapC